MTLSTAIRIGRLLTVRQPQARLALAAWSLPPARFAHIKQGQHEQGRETRHGARKAAVVLGSALGAWMLYEQFTGGRKVLAATKEEPHGRQRKDLPFFTLEEVSKHDSKDKRIWVTFKEGVYDITDFVAKHPGGGEKIMMAAGGSVDPFWMLYGIHKSINILNMLEEYRIGNLSEEESRLSVKDLEDPYAAEPRRHPALRPSSNKPYNAEPVPSLVVESFITPQELFYVRNHLPVPDVAAEDYQLEVEGEGVRALHLNLEQLKKMPKTTVTAAIQCAGNRRSELTKIKAVKGLNWGHTAIGNATWGGVLLRDVLLSAGLKDNQPGVEHVQFEGLDTDATNTPYGASIPIEKAMNPRGDVLLAYEMNGEPLSRDHGFPVRVVVPGTVGARNVKWLGRIVVSGKESDSHWQQNDYKGFSPSTDWDTVDFSKAPAIQELPVVSAICDPAPGSTVNPKGGKVIIRGYAWSGGGRRVVRVDVTADEGRSWHVATLNQEDAKSPRHWGWTLWTLNLPLPPGAKKVEVWAKAVDSSYNTQPETAANIWNLRGVLNNSYHRVPLKVGKSI